MRRTRPGKTAAEVMAAAEEWFIAEGCGRLTMNMVLTGTDSFARPEFKIARSNEVLQGFVLPSLEVAGPGMHWVEVSRAVRARDAVPSDETKRMLEAYLEYYEAAKAAMHAGATCHDVHIAVSKGFTDRGYHLGHVTGHSIGMTMIEFPKVGEGSDFELKENMVLSMHPHAIAANGEDCLYMQDTWLVTADGRRSAGRSGDGDLGSGVTPGARLADRLWQRATLEACLGRGSCCSRSASASSSPRSGPGSSVSPARMPGACETREKRKAEWTRRSRRTTTSSSAASRPTSRRCRRSRSARRPAKSASAAVPP